MNSSPFISRKAGRNRVRKALYTQNHLVHSQGAPSAYQKFADLCKHTGITTILVEGVTSIEILDEIRESGYEHSLILFTGNKTLAEQYPSQESVTVPVQAVWSQLGSVDGVGDVSYFDVDTQDFFTCEAVVTRFDSIAETLLDEDAGIALDTTLSGRDKVIFDGCAQAWDYIRAVRCVVSLCSHDDDGLLLSEAISLFQKNGLELMSLEPFVTNNESGQMISMIGSFFKI